MPFLEHLWQDLRFALRQLSKSAGLHSDRDPHVTLGFGIAAVAIYAFVDAALVQPLPYPEPRRLVNVTETHAADPARQPVLSRLSRLEAAEHRVQRLRCPQRPALCAHHAGGAPARAGRPRERRVFPHARRCSHPGPRLLRGEDRPGKPRRSSSATAAWHARFGGRPDVIGQTVTLAGEPSHDRRRASRLVPVRAARAAPSSGRRFALRRAAIRERSCHALSGVARLKDGVTVEAAHAEMDGIAKRLARQYPDSNRGQGARRLSARSHRRRHQADAACCCSAVPACCSPSPASTS